MHHHNQPNHFKPIKIKSMKKMGLLMFALAFASIATATTAQERTEKASQKVSLTTMEPLRFEYVATMESFDVEIVITATFTNPNGVTVALPSESLTAFAESPRTYRQRQYLTTTSNILTSVTSFENPDIARPDKVGSINRYATNERTDTGTSIGNRYGSNTNRKESTLHAFSSVIKEGTQVLVLTK